MQRAPALVLATALQLVPIARVVTLNPAVAPSGYAIVFRWAAGAVALLGSYHAVSGASAAIAGLANLNPPGPITTNATGTAGQTFAYRIVVTNPGVNPGQAYYNAAPLPAGLTINTNIGGNGWITGSPSTPGVYSVTLVAGNANFTGVVTLNVTITISGSGGTSPPQITGPPTTQTATVGSNVTFTATATGTSPLSYTWKFAGAAIAGATTSALQLSNVQTNNAGLYTVTVTNSVGSASASATLTVQVPPAITTQPQGLTVASGQTASFSVNATGLPLPTYQWKMNGTNLVGQTQATLTISNAQAANAGTYTVDVVNPAGTVTSSPAQLTVQSATVNPVTLANLQWTGGGWTFSVSGPAQTNYVILTSPDLVSWTPMVTNFSASGSLQVTDPSPAPTTRFYRAALSH